MGGFWVTAPAQLLGWSIYFITAPADLNTTWVAVYLALIFKKTCTHSRFDFAVLESACNRYGVAMARNIKYEVDSLPILRDALRRAKAPLQALVREFLPYSNLQGQFKNLLGSEI